MTPNRDLPFEPRVDPARNLSLSGNSVLYKIVLLPTRSSSDRPRPQTFFVFFVFVAFVVFVVLPGGRLFFFGGGLVGS